MSGCARPVRRRSRAGWSTPAVARTANFSDGARRSRRCRRCPPPLVDRMYKEYTKGNAPAALEALAETYRAADGFVVARRTPISAIWWRDGGLRGRLRTDVWP